MRFQQVVMAAIAALTFGVVMHVQAVETVSATPTATTQHPKPAKTTETAAPAFSRPNAQAATAFSLMTPEERKAYRAKMRTLKTPQERQAYRLENRKMMEQRAAEKGEKLRPVSTAEEMRARAAQRKAEQQAADKQHTATPVKKPAIPAEVKAGRH